MSEQELKEIFKLLEDAGWQPQMCDTPIPVYESVHAGNPVEPGQIPPDMTLVPKAFLSMCPESMVRVKGNSMIDQGFRYAGRYQGRRRRSLPRICQTI